MKNDYTIPRIHDTLCGLTGRVLALIHSGRPVADAVSRPLLDDINACKRTVDDADIGVAVSCYMRDASNSMYDVCTIISMQELQQMNIALTYGALCGACGAVGEMLNKEGGAK